MSVLARLGLDRKELRAWVMYDWANSAFLTVVVTGLFPPFFAGEPAGHMSKADANRLFSITTTIALVLIAVASPVLGAIADRTPIKKRFLAVWTAIGVAGTAAMATIGQGDWILALVLFAITNIAANGAFVFYDALLPHVARPDEVDKVSSAGYALGYVAGGVLLAAAGVVVGKPSLLGLDGQASAVRLAFAVTAVWWAVFSIPIFRVVREPHIPDARRARGRAAVRAAFSDLRHTYAELRRYPQASLLLLAFLAYNDGIGTIYRMATAYGTELGLPTGKLITALIVVQFVGIPATFGFGWLAGRIGTRPAILCGLVVYGVVSVYGYFLTTVTDFFILAVLVGLVQGGTQALSRSLFASMIPRHRSSEFFGLFAVFEKFAGILGPAVFAIAQSAFGSSRPAILSIIAFFAIGAILLLKVDVTAGRAAVADVNDGERDAEPEPAGS